MKEICLVVPTIRENCFRDFFERWRAIGLFDHCDLMVMEDNPKPTFDVAGLPSLKDGSRIYHLSWNVIEEELGEHSWIIPRRSDTVRSFAYWKAWKEGYKYILTLDDDCYPVTDADGLRYDGAGFIKNHMEQLLAKSRWFNTLTSVKPRGIPFYNIGSLDNVILNHGLWTNVLDYDAPYQLANPIKENFAFDNRVVPSGQYFPMCGMNVMWRADATVLMYHLMMGRQIAADGSREVFPDQTSCPITDKLPFDRFGDIWCGIILKKIADANKLMVSTGMPYIRHERASNPFANLKKEANGIEVNEKFWEHVDKAPVGTGDLAKDYRIMADHIYTWEEYPEHNTYFKLLGTAMGVWATLFSKE